MCTMSLELSSTYQQNTGKSLGALLHSANMTNASLNDSKGFYALCSRKHKTYLAHPPA